MTNKYNPTFKIIRNNNNEEAENNKSKILEESCEKFHNNENFTTLIKDLDLELDDVDFLNKNKSND